MYKFCVYLCYVCLFVFLSFNSNTFWIFFSWFFFCYLVVVCKLHCCWCFCCFILLTEKNIIKVATIFTFNRENDFCFVVVVILSHYKNNAFAWIEFIIFLFGRNIYKAKMKEKTGKLIQNENTTNGTNDANKK